MKSHLVTFSFFFVFLFLSGNVSAYYLDSPHNESNGIICLTCHNNPAWANGDDPTNLDNTSRNRICLNCHGTPADIVYAQGYIKGPAKKLHASSVTRGVQAEDTANGGFTTQCIDCHHPHFQGQLDWNVSDESKLYLAWGDFTSNPVYVITNDTTTITFFGPIFAQPGFGETSTWTAKGGPAGKPNVDPTTATDGSRGLILVPYVTNPTDTFEIIDVTGNQITVKGKMTGNLDGLTFGVIYGQLIYSLIPDANGNGPKNVKFFQPENISGKHGGFGDETPGSTDPVGICQVCHTNTFYWKNDGTKRSHSFYRSCDACHHPEDGFKPFIHPFMNTVGACEVCHLAQVTPFVSAEGFYHEPSGTTVLSPGEVHSANTCFHCHDAATDALLGSAQNHTPSTISDCMTCHGALKHETNHANINYNVSLDISQFLSQQISCAACHNAWTGDNTSLDTWQGMITEHDSRDPFFDGIGGCATCHDYDGTNGNYNKEDPAIITTVLASNGAPVRCGTCHVNDVINPPPP